jgi:hypothetical protein
MADPGSGHWIFGITVGYGLGLGVGLLKPPSKFLGLKTVAIKTLAPTKAPVPPTTVTTDVALAATATFEVAPATTATFEVAPVTAATFEVAPATAALEAAISANSAVGGVEVGSGGDGAIVIDSVAQSTITSAPLTNFFV